MAGREEGQCVLAPTSCRRVEARDPGDESQETDLLSDAPQGSSGAAGGRSFWGGKEGTAHGMVRMMKSGSLNKTQQSCGGARSGVTAKGRHTAQPQRRGDTNDARGVFSTPFFIWVFVVVMACLLDLQNFGRRGTNSRHTQTNTHTRTSAAGALFSASKQCECNGQNGRRLPGSFGNLATMHSRTQAIKQTRWKMQALQRARAWLECR